MRKHYIAAVCIFRTGSSETLQADINATTGEKWTLYKSPEALNKLTYGDGPVKDNLFIASFTANEDGSNIRGVKFVEELTVAEYKKYKL